MKIYATTPYALSKLHLYASKAKAQAARKPDEVVVELEVDTVPPARSLYFRRVKHETLGDG